MKVTRRALTGLLTGATLNPFGGRISTLVGLGEIAEIYTSRAALSGSGRHPSSEGRCARLIAGRGSGRFQFMADASHYLNSFPEDIRHLQTMVVPLSQDKSGRSGGWARLTEGELRPEWFGAGHGDADEDASAMQAMFDSIGRDGDSVVISDFFYVSRRLHIVGKRKFKIQGTGTIAARQGMAVESDFQCLLISDCEDFLIRDITVDGNRVGRRPAEVAAHAVELRSCRRFRLEGVAVINSVVDCLYIASAGRDVGDYTRHTQDADFVNCRFEDGFRQGVSIVQGRSIRFSGCRFAGTRGTAPAAGVDLESNSGDIRHAVRDISFEDCVFENCAGFGLLVASAKVPTGIHLSRCRFLGNRKGAISWNGNGGSIIDCSFEGFSGRTAERGCIDVGAAKEGGGVEIVRPRFSSVRHQDEAHYLVYVHRAAAGRVRIVDAERLSATHVANFRADACEIVGGDFHLLGEASILLGGSRNAVRNAQFDDAGARCLLISGTDCTIERSTFTAPHLPELGAIIRCYGGGSITIRNNRFVAPEGARGAIYIPAGMRFNLSENSLSGFAQVVVQR